MEQKEKEEDKMEQKEKLEDKMKQKEKQEDKMEQKEKEDDKMEQKGKEEGKIEYKYKQQRTRWSSRMEECNAPFCQSPLGTLHLVHTNHVLDDNFKMFSFWPYYIWCSIRII